MRAMWSFTWMTVLDASSLPPSLMVVSAMAGPVIDAAKTTAKMMAGFNMCILND
jgi:hypothetical protein